MPDFVVEQVINHFVKPNNMVDQSDLFGGG